MADLLKHGLWKYCGQSDCPWFDTCGLGLRDQTREKAKAEGLNIPLKEYCTDYHHRAWPEQKAKENENE